LEVHQPRGTSSSFRIQRDEGRSAAAVDAPQIEDRDGVAGSAAACYRLEPVDRLSLRRVANPLDARTKI
jgi:hypothetical protein